MVDFITKKKDRSIPVSLVLLVTKDWYHGYQQETRVSSFQHEEKCVGEEKKSQT